MTHKATSIRAFIGAKNYSDSKAFYKELGFEEHPISKDMSYFKVTENIGFYLQDYYAADWINNSQIFLEVDSVERYYDEIQSLQLTGKYKNVRLTHIHNNDWGKEFFMHDPSGILWHFGAFY
jgi:catechol 2,3-dioxygenase-like lactoylglutathione lyase family enzyme